MTGPPAIAAVVLAAGSSSRMGADQPVRKQFLELAAGERIVDRVVATCRTAAGWVGLVLPADVAWDGAPVDAVVEGGADRSASVAAGVAAVPAEAEIVVVHSASHPLASPRLLERVIAAVEDGADGVVPLVAAADTIKRRNPDGTLSTVGRADLGAAQAPMAYRREILDQALAQAGSQIDESIAVEAVGGRVVAIDGELTNLHVTDPASLKAVRHLVSIA